MATVDLLAPKHATSAGEAVRLIKSGDRVYLHAGSAVPGVLLGALLDRSSELHDVELIHLHVNGGVAKAASAAAPNIRRCALFVDSSTRDAVATGAATYLPVFLSDVPRLFSTGRLPLDVALLHVSPPDAHGYCSLGVSVDCTLAAARAAPVRIAQINPRMPRTHGDSFVHVNDFDAMVEVDEPLPEASAPVITAAHLAVARNVAELIEDGATLQLGIGAIPNAVLGLLGDRRELGVHSEVVSDGVLELVSAGVITGSRKTINRGKLVVAFLNGSRRLYDFADDNPMLEMRSFEYTNDTRTILRLDNMVAINSALQIDLTGQVCAEFDRHPHVQRRGWADGLHAGSGALARGPSGDCPVVDRTRRPSIAHRRYARGWRWGDDVASARALGGHGTRPRQPPRNGLGSSSPCSDFPRGTTISGRVDDGSTEARVVPRRLTRVGQRGSRDRRR